MRSAKGIAATVLAVGVAVIAVLGLTHTTTLAFTLGVPVAGPVTSVSPGFSVCQVEISGPEGVRFDEIDLVLGTFEEREGPPVRAVVRAPDGDVLSEGLLPGGYPDITVTEGQTIPLADEARVRNGMTVCLRNEGTTDLAVYGAPDVAAAPTSAVIPSAPGELDPEAGDEDPAVVGADLALEFHREERSYLSLVGDMGERMRLFRQAPLLPAWLYLTLVLGLLGAAGAALVAAVGAAERTGGRPADAPAGPRNTGW